MIGDKLFLWLIAALLLANIVCADVGPKPTMNVEVRYEGKSISEKFYSAVLDCKYSIKYEPLLQNLSEENVSDWMNECSRRAGSFGLKPDDCFEMQYIREKEDINYSMQHHCLYYGNDILACKSIVSLKVKDESRGCYWTYAPFAWGGDCENSRCSAFYMLPQNFRFAVYLPSMNKTFVSNEVNRTNFHSTFEANLFQNGTIELRETTPYILSNASMPLRYFLLAFVITLTIEMPLIFLYVHFAKRKLPEYEKKRNRILLTALFANIFSLAVVWVTLLLSGAEWMGCTLLPVEALAVAIEAGALALINKDAISWPEAALLSIAANVISFVVGGSIFVLIAATLFLIFGI